MDTAFGFPEWLTLLKKKAFVIGAGFLIGLIMGYLLTSFVLTPKYSSTTQLMVNRPAETGQVINLSDLQTNVQLINTYKNIIEDPVILEPVSAAVNFKGTHEELKKRMEIIVQEESQIFGIRVVDTDPIQAAFMANTVAKTFQDNISKILSVENVAILSPAEPDPVPISPNLAFNLAIGGMIGLLMGLVISLLSTLLDQKVRDEETVLQLLEMAPIGSVSEMTPEDRRLSMEPERVGESPATATRYLRKELTKEAEHVS